MRVISGKFGGRNFASPHGNRTHPMSDKMRGALFNALGDIEGLSVLDAFAGSGALAFEAISRGAKSAVAIDSDRSAQRAIADNIASLGVRRQVKLIKAGVSAWLSTANERFDIVLCDPPYDDISVALLLLLAERAEPLGLVVFSLPPAVAVQLPPEYELLTVKSYGDSQLVFYRRRA